MHGTIRPLRARRRRRRAAGRGGRGPSSTFQPRSGMVSARAEGSRAAPSSSRARTSRPLVALLKWLTTLRWSPTCWSTRTVATRRARSLAGSPERGVRGGAQVDHQAGAGSLAHHRVEHAAPVRRDHAEAGQVHPAGQPVGRDPVAQAHQPEQRRGDRQGAGGPTAGGGIERGQVEGVVEDTGVDRVRAGGGAVGQAGVAAYLVDLGGAQPQRPRCQVRVRPAELDQRGEWLLAGRGEAREAEVVEVERLARVRGSTCPPTEAAGSAPRQPRGAFGRRRGACA